MLTKTVKFGLIYDDSNELPYIDKSPEASMTEDGFRRDAISVMLQCQREMRAALNAMSSEYKVHVERLVRYHEENGEWPKSDVVKGWYDGKAVATKLYQEGVKRIKYLTASSIATASNACASTWNSHMKEFLRGDMAFPSFGKDQPIQLPAANVELMVRDDKVYAKLGILSMQSRDLIGIHVGRLLFRVQDKDKGSRVIIERCLSGEYKPGKVSLQYDKKKRMWFCSMAFSFKNPDVAFDPQKILGVDLGVANVACYKISGKKTAIFVRGGEVEHFRASTQARKRSLQMQRPFAGDGSVGHGYGTRMDPVLQIRDREARFRDTYNHKISREIVAYAKKNGCGTIQMEDLSGISKEHKFLKDWPYFDLQTKIEYKAKEHGIAVVKVPAYYTSQRCSKCGCICEDNVHDNYRRFTCQSCGYDADSDYNAAENISIKNIGKVIDSEIKQSSANVEQTEIA